MISKNDELVGVVTAMGAGGEGIIKENGIVIFVPFFILFLMMLIVALNRQRFVSHPRFVKFCFPNYSLPLK